MDEKKSTDRTYDDGGSGSGTQEQLESFLAEVQRIGSDVGQKVVSRRIMAEDVRYARWPGQSSDGRQYDDLMKDTDRKRAFPFDGCPDERNRLADGAIRYKASKLGIALMRALRNPIVTGNDLQDAQFGSDMAQVLKWLIRSQWKSSFVRDVQLTSSLMLGDSPGACVVASFMNQEWGLEEVEVTPESIVETLIEREMLDPEQVGELARIMETVTNPQLRGEAVELVMGLFPTVKKKRAQRMVRELSESGKTGFPVPIPLKNIPEIRVLRLYEDIFFAKESVGLHDQNIYVTEYVSAVDLRARVVTQGYDQQFVDELIGEGAFSDERSGSKGHAGKSAFSGKEFASEGSISGDGSQDNDARLNLNEDRYELITVYFRASNEDGIGAFYQQTFSSFVAARPATERKLSYKSGSFPGVFFSREVLTKYLLDTRGISETLMSDQGLLKMFSDLFGAGAQLKTLPALGVNPMRGAQGAVTLGPLVNVKRRKASDIEPIELGSFPREAFEHMKDIRRRVAEFEGLPHGEVHEEITRMIAEMELFSWLSGWSEVFVLVLQQVQEYFTDDQLERIAGAKGERIRRKTSEIQGQFDLTLHCSVDDFDTEMNVKRAGLIKDAIALDTDQTLNRSQYVRLIAMLAVPEYADQLVQPLEQAQKREIDDEEMLFTKIIAAGLEPPLDEDPKAKNYALRLEWLQNQMESNPAWEQSPDLNRQILLNHIENYVQMSTQGDNAAIGRAGTGAVLSN